MKAHWNKFRFITNKQNYMNLKIGSINIEKTACEKLLGVKKNTRRKVNTLRRVFPLIYSTKNMF